MRPIETLLLAAAVGLGGCATLPVGPNVLVLPGERKSLAEFQADDAGCREWAGQRVGVTPAQASGQALATGAAIGMVVGAAGGAAIGAAAGSPATGAAVGSGVGLLGGTAAGAHRSGERWTVQNRYDAAYVQCMYATGNQVPLPRGASSYSGPAAGTSAAAASLPPGVPPPPAGIPPPPPPAS